MIFNIYYINFPKVYEIKMMLGNLILLSKELESNKNTDGEAELTSKFDLGAKFLKLFSAEAEVKGKISGSSARKVLETFEVKTTKSIILNDVIESAKIIKIFNNIDEGQLVRIDNVSLSLENEPELRIMKLFTSDAFKGMVVPGASGVDMGSIFNSMFKDYAYKIMGSISNFEQKILVKIPFTFESEFESSYSVDDLFIGRVSVIGLYKGKIGLDELKNSLEFFQEIGDFQQGMNNVKKANDEIQDSHYDIEDSTNKYSPFLSKPDDNEKYHYIDLLSIVQIINILPKP